MSWSGCWRFATASRQSCSSTRRPRTQAESRSPPPWRAASPRRRRHTSVALLRLQRTPARTSNSRGPVCSTSDSRCRRRRSSNNNNSNSSSRSSTGRSSSRRRRRRSRTFHWRSTTARALPASQQQQQQQSWPTEAPAQLPAPPPPPSARTRQRPRGGATTRARYLMTTRSERCESQCSEFNTTIITITSNNDEYFICPILYCSF